MSQRQKKLDLMSGKLGIMQIKNTFMKNIKFFKKTNKKKKIIYYLWIFKRNTYKYNFTDFIILFIIHLCNINKSDI